MGHGQPESNTAAADAAAARDADGPAVVHGRIKQSIVSWCFTAAGEMWSIDRMCQVARQLGVAALDSPAPEHWPTLGKYGLRCAWRRAECRGRRGRAVTTIPNITTR